MYIGIIWVSNIKDSGKHKTSKGGPQAVFLLAGNFQKLKFGR